MSLTPKIYFSGLNALRFFAAYFVLLHHGETIRAKYAMPNLEHFSLFRNGAIAVSFFFTLSGFLITYLLLDEIKRTGTVSIKKFYIRRILRIWPLYYLLVFIGLVVVPVILKLIQYNYPMPYDTFNAGILFLLFLSFVVNILYGSHLLEPLWSIGVEEYFYLIWAPLFRYFKHKALTIILGVLAVKILSQVFFNFYTNSNSAFNLIKEIILTLKFELMAIGGLGAYAVFHFRDEVKKGFYFSPLWQMFFIALLIMRLFFDIYLTENQFFIYILIFKTPVLGTITEGVLFLWLILNVSVNGRSIFTLSHPVLEKLGDISYGIYMYQMLVIFGTVLLFKNFILKLPPSVGTAFFYLIITAGTILLAWFSKKYFEDKFLKLKHRFDY